MIFHFILYLCSFSPIPFLFSNFLFSFIRSFLFFVCSLKIQCHHNLYNQNFPWQKFSLTSIPNLKIYIIFSSYLQQVCYEKIYPKKKNEGKEKNEEKETSRKLILVDVFPRWYTGTSSGNHLTKLTLFLLIVLET